MLGFIDMLAEVEKSQFTVGLAHFVIVSLILFSLGLAVILIKRNAIWMLMGVELILNSAGLNFVAFSFFSARGGKISLPNFDGQIMTIFIIILAAAEAAVGLAIILLIYHHRRSINPDELKELKH